MSDLESDSSIRGEIGADLDGAENRDLRRCIGYPGVNFVDGRLLDLHFMISKIRMA